MKYWNRTLSYLKRNGPVDTFWAIAERKDETGMDQWQRRTKSYGHEIKKQQLLFPVKNLSPEVLEKAEGGCFKSPVLTDDKHPVCVSVVVPAYETKKEYFCQMIESVLAQTYINWQLVIADASESERLSKAAASYADPRITYVHLTMNEGISDNTNAGIPHAYGDYIGFLDHDDILAPDALSEVVKCITKTGALMVYTDEDKVSADLSERFEPNIKPAFNLDLLLTNNYICHFTVVEAGLMKKLGFRYEYDGAQDYDMILRAVLGIEWERTEESERKGGGPGFGMFPADYFRSKVGHVPRILYHWRAHENSTADNPDTKRYAYEAGKRALEDFYAQLDWDTEVRHTKHLGFYETTYYPDLFSVRKDVWGICGRSIRHGRVSEGPVLGGVKLFEGMNYHYSGYLHRAALPFDVDKAPAHLIRTREGEQITGERKAGGRLLYQPGFLVRDKRSGK